MLGGTERPFGAGNPPLGWLWRRRPDSPVLCVLSPDSRSTALDACDRHRPALRPDDHAARTPDRRRPVGIPAAVGLRNTALWLTGSRREVSPTARSPS